MRDGRGYKREGDGSHMSRKMRERETSRRKKDFFLLMICVLLALNILFSVRQQAKIRELERELNQVMSRMTINVQEENIPAPESRAEDPDPQDQIESKIPGQENRVPETVGQEKVVDYVSQCGLPSVDKPRKRSAREVLERLKDLSKDSDLIAEIYEEHSLYDDDMLKALANNPEMADFVRNSLEADSRLTGAALSVLETGQDYPLFLQWDPRWGYEKYGENNVGLSGCGPTCLSMALYYLLRDDDLTPEKIAKYSMDNDYYVIGSGTAWALLEDVPKMYGINVEQPRATEDTMKEALDQGSIIICSMKSGDFTDGGHFVVVYGYDENGFFINDSNCVARSREKWDFGRLKKQIKNIWVYSKTSGTTSSTTPGEAFGYDS